jgi:hypothetical protein
VPVKRRLAKTRIAADVDPIAWALMTDPPDLAEQLEADRTAMRFCYRWMDVFMDDSPTLEQLWAKHGPAIVEDWVQDHPGTRPRCWWVWSAPDAKPGAVYGCMDYYGAPANQTEQLEGWGLLTAAERRALKLKVAA